MIKWPLLVKMSDRKENKLHYSVLDDYRLTACTSFLKLIQNRCKGVIEPDMSSILAMSSDNPTDDRVASTTNEEEPTMNRSLTMLPGQLTTKPSQGKLTANKKVPVSAIDFALTKVNNYTLARDHEDIDISLDVQGEPTDEQWTQFIEQFYLASQ